MKIISLLENTTQKCGMEVEHGLSLYIEANGKRILFDMGQSDLFARNAERLGIDLSEVDVAVISHGHYDHAEFVEEYARLLPGAEVIAHEAENAVLSDSLANVSQFFGTPRRYMSPNRTVKGGDKLTLGATEYEVISTPGHTPGSICVYSHKERLIFTGDTLFCRGYGRTDFKYGSDVELIASLRRLSRLDGDITVLSGHGMATTIGEELR